MEVVAIEGSLTDFEVLELLNSTIYSSLPDLSQHQNSRRHLQQAQTKYEGLLAPHEKTLQTLQTRFNAGQLTEAAFRASCSQTLKRSSNATKGLSEIRTDMAYLNRIENTIYMKTKLGHYLNSLPCRDQTQEIIANFFSKLEHWQNKWHTSIEPAELTMLLNLRPTSDTLLSLVLNGFLDRVPQVEARTELVTIIQELPQAPEIIDEDEDNEDEDAVGDEEENEASDLGEEERDHEFDTTAAAQRDQDDDGYGSD